MCRDHYKKDKKIEKKEEEGKIVLFDTKVAVFENKLYCLRQNYIIISI